MGTNRVENEINQKPLTSSEMDNKLTPNFIAFASRAIGRNAKLYEDINRLYEGKQVEYNNSVIENKVYKSVYDSDFFKQLEFFTALYSRKLFSIMCYMTQKMDKKLNEEIMRLVIKGWNKLYKYVQNSQTISISDITMMYIKKDRECTVNDIIDIETIACFLCYKLDRHINNNEEAYKIYAQQIRYDAQTKIQMNKKRTDSILGDISCGMTNEDKSKIDIIIKSIFNGIEHIDIADKLIFNDDKFIQSYSSKVANIFSFENLDCTEVYNNYKISKRDLEEILYCYFSKYNAKYEGFSFDIDETNIDIEDATKFLVNNLYLKLLMKEYNKIKKFYFSHSTETMFLKLQALQKEIDGLKSTLNVKSQEYDSLLKTNQELERENKRLKHELEEMDNNKMELSKLREFLFSLDGQQEYNQDDVVNYETLQNTKGVIVGGTQKWQQKIKETLSGWDFINMDTINFDENIIKNADIVVIYVNYLSHALYYRVMKIVNKNNTRVIYINYNQNIDIVEKEIYNSVVNF